MGHENRGGGTERTAYSFCTLPSTPSRLAQVVSGVVRQSYEGADGKASEKLQARGRAQLLSQLWQRG